MKCTVAPLRLRATNIQFLGRMDSNAMQRSGRQSFNSWREVLRYSTERTLRKCYQTSRMRHNDRKPPQMDIKDDLKTVLEKLIEHILIKSRESIELVGPNPRAASGFTDVYSVWLKCQVRERVSVLSLDIGTGFQIFRRRFTEIQAHLEGCAPRPAEG